MKKKINEKIQTVITIPEGSFCGNCGSCRFANYHDKDRYGRVWCDYYNRYNFASDRNGCFGFKREE